MWEDEGQSWDLQLSPPASEGGADFCAPHGWAALPSLQMAADDDPPPAPGAGPLQAQAADPDPDPQAAGPAPLPARFNYQLHRWEGTSISRVSI